MDDSDSDYRFKEEAIPFIVYNQSIQGKQPPFSQRFRLRSFRRSQGDVPAH